MKMIIPCICFFDNVLTVKGIDDNGKMKNVNFISTADLGVPLTLMRSF